MARPQKSRRICGAPAVDRFTPDLPVHPAAIVPGLEDSVPVILTVDEYEALRLIDHEGLTHSECAKQMNISRTTATEICESARKKVAAAIVRGRELIIEGGNWEFCKGDREDCFLSPCTRRVQHSPPDSPDSPPDNPPDSLPDNPPDSPPDNPPDSPPDSLPDSLPDSPPD